MIKIIFAGFVLVSMHIFVSAIAFSSENKSSPFENQVQKAQELCDSYKYEEAESILDKVLDADKTCTEAYYLLAKIYLKEGTVRGRTKAEEMADKAIKYMPDNPEYHIALVNIFVEQDFRKNAENYLAKLTKRFPDNPEILLMLGRFHRENAERMYDTIAAGTPAMGDENSRLYEFGRWFGESIESYRARSSPLFSQSHMVQLGGFIKEEMEKAREMYNKIQTIRPHYEDVDRQLALLAYHEKDWISMIDYAQDFVNAYPDDRNAHLILGLAHHRLGNYKEANESFQTFMKRVLPYECSYLDYFDQFLSDEQQERISQMHEDEKNRFHKEFWKSRDPLYLTNYNERKLEHYARIAEAHLLFSAPKYDVEGWKTDRGIIWMRYGPPNRMVKKMNYEHVG